LSSLATFVNKSGNNYKYKH